MAFALVCAFFSLVSQSAWATDPKWYAVQISATVQTSPAKITLTWPTDPNSQGYSISRKTTDAASWTSIASVSGSTGSYVDNNVTVGNSYEYQISSPTPWNYTGYGYITVGIQAPLVETRGKVLLVVDNTYAASLATELTRLQQDLVGDGWTVVRRDVSRHDSPANVKNVIKTEYYADAANLKSVFLFGHVPVPYSGNFNPDGHPDHEGAWPADVYYGDMDGNWTDSSTWSGGATRQQNKNTPGDGKFDQSDIPSNVELPVGRVDLANMTVFATERGQNELALLRNYLNKDHNFRHSKIRAQRRGLICDNFDESGGEAYAASGWRAFSAFFGANNVTKAGEWQYFSSVGTSDYLWSYGCGGGSYDHCWGVGGTVDFARTDIKSVFTMFLGSYFGDWDAENNFLRGPLAAQTYGLASVWAGRPHWFFHPMGIGQTLGYCTKLSQNNGNGGKYSQQNWGSRGVHVALMGDPTLRMHVVIPPSNLSLNNGTLTWTASTDSNLKGYHVYRATSVNGPFTRVTSAPIIATTFTDSAAGTFTYIVKAIKLENSGSGSYFNSSQGIFSSGSSSGGGGGTPVPTVPVAPTQVAAAVSSAVQIKLSWKDASTNESGFKIERKVGPTGSFSQIGTVGANVTNFNNSGLLSNTLYTYRLRSYNAVGDSSYSSEASSATVSTASVVFAKTDQTTLGSWRNVYGGDGYVYMGETSTSSSLSKYPSYVQLSGVNKGDWTWEASTWQLRALQKARPAMDRIAGSWSSSGSFTVDLNLTDGLPHRVAVYCVDWERAGREQTVDVLDAASDAVLDTRTLSAFNAGKYLVWKITGHVKLRFTRTAGPNAVVSGIFFGPVPTVVDANQAEFVKFDTETKGNWKNVYGSEGQKIVGFSPAFPNYLNFGVTGATAHTWARSSSDSRALQKVNSSDRIAAAWCAGNFTVDMNFTDGNSHQVAFYCLDWDNRQRSQKIQIFDATTGALLNSRTVSNFGGGSYVVWELKGHVRVRFTSLSGPNVALAGIFVGPGASL